MPRAYVQPKAIIKSLQYLNPNDEVLLSSKTLEDTDSPLQRLDPGDDNYHVVLPNPAECTGLEFRIMNASTGTGKLQIYDYTNVNLLETVDAGSETKMTCFGTDWYSYAINSNSSTPTPTAYTLNFDDSMTVYQMQLMIDAIPKELEIGLDVTFAAGTYSFDTHLKFENFHGGDITINGHEYGGPNLINNDVTFNITGLNNQGSLYFYNVSSYIYTHNINFGGSYSGGVILFDVKNCPQIRLYRIIFNGENIGSGTGLSVIDSSISADSVEVRGFSNHEAIYARNSSLYFYRVTNSTEAGATDPRFGYCIENCKSVCFKNDIISDASESIFKYTDNETLYMTKRIIYNNTFTRLDIPPADCFRKILYTNEGATDDVSFRLPDGETGMEIVFAGDASTYTMNVYDSSNVLVKTVYHTERVSICWSGTHWCS